FKRINDSHGHAAGDEVLRTLGAFLKRTLRASDFATRYGGEEFALVLPHTNPSEATRLAERIRNDIASLSIPISARTEPQRCLRVTVSIGVATLTPNGRWTRETSTTRASDYGSGHGRGQDPARWLLDRADAGVYAAKSAGRNRVCSAPRLSDPG
ncbi:MAG: GGDEF domain-containing protein, partial [Gammaproteobacteria bacterium]|nr:GGDEF domain-containing protein [Gammaproteobacteria bacterium]